MSGEKRVLVVDDDEPIRRLVSTVLTRAGFLITEARNGIEAIQSVKEEAYHAILLDLMMPLASGFDVMNWMASHQKEKLMCVVVMTAATDREISELNHEVVYAVMRKPFDLEKLVRVVAECAGGEAENISG